MLAIHWQNMHKSQNVVYLHQDAGMKKKIKLRKILDDYLSSTPKNMFVQNQSLHFHSFETTIRKKSQLSRTPRNSQAQELSHLSNNTPLKINGWNIIMEVWFRSFSSLNEWFVGEPAVNLPGCNRKKKTPLSWSVTPLFGNRVAAWNPWVLFPSLW